jgi:hypothetical protein
VAVTPMGIRSTLMGTPGAAGLPTSPECPWWRTVTVVAVGIPCRRLRRARGGVLGAPRVVAMWLLVAGLSVGCSSSTSGSGSAGGRRHPSLPATCTHMVTHGDDVPRVLAGASAGDTVCFSGPDFADTDVLVARSGTAAAPIRLVADELVTVHEMQVKADHVIVEGFTVAGGGGVLLEGTGIVVRDTMVHDTQQGGITCHPCTDSIVESNTMRHVATNGIDITGQRITVRDNTISDTVPVHGGDADGVRFYGNGHRITGNTVSDISAEGYASPPHPDCFQTLDNGKPATFDVVISGNTCRNVDAQCLIATGDQDSNSGAPPGAPSIIFVGNTCANNGAQAVNLRRWPNVQILRNTFSGPNLTRAVLIADGSTGATVVGNTTTGDRPTVQVDDSSRPGSHVQDNRPA